MCKSCKYLDRCDGGCREAANVNYSTIDAMTHALIKIWDNIKVTN